MSWSEGSYGGGHNRMNFALIVVLFILLIIVGTAFVGYQHCILDKRITIGPIRPPHTYTSIQGAGLSSSFLF